MKDGGRSNAVDEDEKSGGYNDREATKMTTTTTVPKRNELPQQPTLISVWYPIKSDYDKHTNPRR